jgi:hypothetical protein
MLLAVLTACPAPKTDPAAPRMDIAATGLATLDRDATAQLELLRSLHAEAGATVAGNLTIDLGKLDDLSTQYDDDEIRIRLPAPAASPDEARTYWDAWSKATAGGTWEYGPAFKDDVELTRLTRFAAFVTLSRQVGAFLQATYAGKLEPGARELLVDKLAIAVIDRLASRPELAELMKQYRGLLDAWYMAIPEATRSVIPADADLDKWCAENPIPEGIAQATSLQLARQLRLLAKPPKLKALITDALLGPHQARLAKIDYGTAKVAVTTGRDVPGGYAGFRTERGSLRELTLTTLDTAGQFHHLACAQGACEYSTEGGTPKKLAVANLLGGEAAAFERVFDLAVTSDKLWLLLGAYGDGKDAALAVLDLARPDAIKPSATWQSVEGGKLAASPSGAVSVMVQRGGGWTVERFDPTGKRGESWTFRLEDADADGKPGIAGGALADCTSSDTGTLYCTSGVRVRVVERDRIWTLAGGARDWIDANDPRKVAFTSPHRLRSTKDGFQLVDRRLNGDNQPIWKVRQIELKK